MRDITFSEHCLRKLGERGAKSYLVRRIFLKEEYFKYHSSKINIGVSTENYKNIAIDFSTAHRAIIFGKTRSGKTFNMLSILSRFVQNKNNSAIIPCAIKNEFSVISQPLEGKYKKYLLPKERPAGLKVKHYRPFFLEKILGTNYKDQVRYSININNFSSFDFLAFLPDDFLKYRATIEDIFYTLREKDIFSKENFSDYINNVKELNNRQKAKIIKEIENLEKLKLINFNEKEELNFTNDINENFIPVINLQGLETLPEIERKRCAIFISHPLKELFLSKANKKIEKNKKILVLLDEAELWYPRGEESSSKEIIKRYLDIGAQYGFSLYFSYKDISRVEPTIFRQAKYIFVPRTTLSEAKEIIKETLPGYYDNPYTFTRDVAFEFSDMRKYKDGQREWKIINTENQTIEQFIPLAPLCKVPEERRV